jgi:ABC-type phosphate/phosphonate transport system substrate-binding protein
MGPESRTMTRNDTARLCWLVSLGMSVLLGAAGCAHEVGDAVMVPMRAMLRMKPPVRIGITRVHVNPVVQAPWGPLEQALARKLGRDVQVIAYRPFQIRSQLQRGYLDFAILSATDYAEIGQAETCDLVSQPVNSLGQNSRHGLIIAKKDSKIHEMIDLKGQRFAFGPSWDAVSHLAAAYALMQAGLEPSDVPRDLLPVPMAQRHHLDSFEVAKAVAYEPLVSAGAVDEVEYASLPETGGSVMFQTVSKDEFRVVGRTVNLPEGPIVASRKADPKMVALVKDYLLSGQVPDKALKAMKWQRMVPVQASEYAATGLIVQKLHQAGWVREDVPQMAASEPAEGCQETSTMQSSKGQAPG